MKKTIIILLTVLLPVFAWGQAQINTKKVKLSDFTQKVTKIVLSGNAFVDGTLKDEVIARWRISPYEFCTVEEFESLKHDEDYYFLINATGQFKKETEPSLQFLTLVKGGKGAQKGIDDMLEVVSFPLASAQFPSGREHIFLPAILDIIQEYTLESMEKDINAYGGLANFAEKITSDMDAKIVFAREDINEAAIHMTESHYLNGYLTVEDEEDADSHMIDNEMNHIVSYVVAASDPKPGTFCYKMLIDTNSHKLYYYRKHKISKNAGVGFLENDIKNIYSARTPRKEK